MKSSTKSESKSSLERKYGPITAVCMVVGTIIGSGIFFRNEEVLAVIGSRMYLGILAWVLCGFITLTGAYVFSTLCTRYDNTTSLLGFLEHMVGKTFGHLFGWYLAITFYPSLAGILAWVSARFTVILFGWDANPSFSGQTYALAMFYLISIFAINTLSPKLSGKFQVSTTFIKVIPLIAMGIVGTIAGLMNGTTAANIQSNYITAPLTGTIQSPFFIAITATAFAYLGWDSIISIKAEIDDPKRNMPLALVGGTLIVIMIYVLYFIGLFSAAPIDQLAGGEGVRHAFVQMFTPVAGTALFVFIVVSCLGTLNGLIIASQRAIHSLAEKGHTPHPKTLSQLDPNTNAPVNSSVLSLVFIAFWIVVYSGNFSGWFGGHFLDIPGLVPITFQIFVVPLYISVILRERSFGTFNRFIAPTLASIGGLFLLFVATFNAVTNEPRRLPSLIFMLFAITTIAVGYLYTNRRKGEQ